MAREESEQRIEEQVREAIGAAGPRAAFVIRIPRAAGLALAALAIVLAGFLALAFTMHWWGWGLSPEAKAEREVAQTVSDVAELIVLPEGETPIVATITDAEALKRDQAFYQDAQNGDVLLVFNQAQRAMLYRPSAHRLINVAPIYFAGDAPAASE